MTMTTTTANEYYNVVLNPGDVPVLGIDDTVQKPLPLPEPEPEPEPEQERIHAINIDVRSVEIRKVYKIIHFIMLFTTITSIITYTDYYQTITDTFISAISYFSVLENKIDILKIHTFYLTVCLTLATYNLYFEYISYYLVYGILNISTIVQLSLDRRDYYINQLISEFPNP